MSGSIVSFGGSSSITITELLTALQSVRRGYDETSLTNYSTQALPAIAAGSCCEIGGALYKFSTQEPISTTNVASTANCTYFVELVASSSTVSARFSTITPAWREDYNGWYESTVLPYRVIAEMEKDGASTYYWYKKEFKYLDRLRNKETILSIYLSSDKESTSASHYISNVLVGRVQSLYISEVSTGVCEFFGDYTSYIYSTYLLVSMSTLRNRASYAQTTVVYI